MFREDTNTLIMFTLHPFATRCYVVIQKSQRFNEMTDTAEACLYLLKAGYTPFSHHAFVDASQAHIVMRGNNQLQITGRVIFPCLKGDSEPALDPTTPTPSPFGNNIGDPQLPAALQGASSNKGSLTPPQQRRMRPHQSDAFCRSIAGRLKLLTARRDQSKALTLTHRSLRRYQSHPQPNRRDIRRVPHR